MAQLSLYERSRCILIYKRFVLFLLFDYYYYCLKVIRCVEDRHWRVKGKNIRDIIEITRLYRNLISLRFNGEANVIYKYSNDQSRISNADLYDRREE